MSVPTFKDLDKSALELITKGFPTGTQGFEVEGGSAETIKFKATGTHTSESLNSLFETTKTCCPGMSFKVSAKAEKKVPVYAAEVTYEPKALEGVKVTASSECKLPESGEVNTQKVTVLVKKEKFTFEDTLSYSAGVASFAASLAVAHQSVQAGLSVASTFTLAEKAFALTGYGFKLGYVPCKSLNFVTMFDKTTKGMNACSTLYYKKNATEAAGQLCIDPSKPTAAPAFTAALSHAVDDKTTVKAKLVTATPSVSLSVKHQLSDAISVTLASECACPIKDGEKAAATHKHGVAVNLKL